MWKNLKIIFEVVIFFLYMKELLLVVIMLNIQNVFIFFFFIIFVLLLFFFDYFCGFTFFWVVIFTFGFCKKNKNYLFQNLHWKMLLWCSRFFICLTLRRHSVASISVVHSCSVDQRCTMSLVSPLRGSSWFWGENSLKVRRSSMMGSGQSGLTDLLLEMISGIVLENFRVVFFCSQPPDKPKLV